MKLTSLIGIAMLGLIVYIGFTQPITRFSSNEGCDSQVKEIHVFKEFGLKDTILSLFDNEDIRQKALLKGDQKALKETCQNFELYIF